MPSAVDAVPERVRVAMAHAALQLLADTAAIEVLHVKGLAVDPALGRRRPGGTDADVLVRPDHVERFLAVLRSAGWRQRTTFASDSDFGSAATFQHPQWGFADVHRFFPGIGAPADAAFERLWADRGTREIAGLACTVPDLVGQSVILVLNAARTVALGTGAADVAAMWESAPPQRRQAMARLVDELGAQVAFAAATGELDRHRGARDYDLWRIESRGGTRLAKWWARIRAAPTARDGWRLALRAPMVNVDHLSVMLGRQATRTDVAREFFARPARGVAESLQARRSRQGGEQ